MKIVSPFKDCYDWVSHMYGGGDPRLTYDRRPIPGGENGYVDVNVDKNTRIETWQCPHLYFQTLIFCGKVFPLVSPSPMGNYKVLNKKCPYYDKVVEESSKNNNFYRDNLKYYLRNEMNLSYSEISTSPSAIKLSKLINQPVFIMTDGYFWDKIPKVKLLTGIPKLGDSGFTTVLPPEQIYQEISQFIGNVLRESPDTQPPANVSDKERLIQKGFDSKISFRTNIKLS